MTAVIVDANLLVLLIVGSTERRLIPTHKNLSNFDVADFDLLVQAISLYSDIVLLPHIIAEASSLSRQIGEPARSRIQTKFAELVETAGEVHVASVVGVRRREFKALGVTDALILHLCAQEGDGIGCALLTADNDLAVSAEMSGYEVLNFMHLR